MSFASTVPTQQRLRDAALLQTQLLPDGFLLRRGREAYPRHVGGHLGTRHAERLSTIQLCSSPIISRQIWRLVQQALELVSSVRHKSAAAAAADIATFAVAGDG